MDGKGVWRKNVFVERLWRTTRYERVYLTAYEAVSAARSDSDTYIDWYNRERVHSRTEDRTSEHAYWALLPELAVAV
jgi:putative transposase